MSDSLIRITVGRESLWEALETYAATKTLYNHKFKLDDDGAALNELEPSIAQMPAIAIETGEGNPKWWLNVMQHWPITYKVTIWTPNWDQSVAERYLELTNEAFHRAVAAGRPGVTIVKDKTSWYPQTMAFRLRRVRLKSGKDTPGHKAMQIDMTVVLFADRNPLTYSGT